MFHIVHTTVMPKEQFFTPLTYKICLRTNQRADGSSTIMLRVTIARKKRDYNLNISWPISKFDMVAGKALPMDRHDKDVETINQVIDSAKYRALHIKMSAFAKGKVLTQSEFEREFKKFESRESFLWFYRDKLDRRYRMDDISKGTFKHHQSTLDNNLMGFLNGRDLNFSEITVEFLQEFAAWLRKKYMYNTVVAHLKNVKTYLSVAVQEGIIAKSPFSDYKTNNFFREGFREALDANELATLIKMLKKKLQPVLRSVLERFLFSCFTGIRISDVSRLTSGMIRNGVMSVKMKKGERYGKVAQIPLPAIAADLVKGRNGRLFEPLADQTCNDMLKIIAGIANINKRLTFRVSRDTFATQFIEMGGDAVTLKELLGHSSIATTMIYVKITEKRKELLMGNFDKLFGPKPKQASPKIRRLKSPG